RLAQLRAQETHVEAQRGEARAEVVVDLAGDAAALVLLQLAHGRGEAAELFARLAQGHLVAPPLRDVESEVDHADDVSLEVAKRLHAVLIGAALSRPLVSHRNAGENV